MFIAKKTVTIHNCNVSIVKDEEVKPGVVKKAEKESPGFTERYLIELPDNYIQRQTRWLKVIQEDIGIPMLWLLINKVFVTHIPEDKKVGQWCVGKQNKISESVVKQFPDIVKLIPNEYKNSSHNWDGDYQHVILDDNQLQTIEEFIEYQCLLLM